MQIVSGNQLQVTRNTGFFGTLVVTATVRDPGGLTDSETFNVEVPNNAPVNRAPVLAAIGNRTMPSNSNTLTVNLSATDPDNDVLTFSATIQGGGDPLELKAYQLDQQYQLGPEDVPSRNWGGANEKWMKGANNQWYFITPNGNFYRWTGAAKGANFLSGSTLIDTLSSAYHTNVSLLHNAFDGTPPVSAGGTVQIVSGNQLQVTPSGDFTGTLMVTATVRDPGGLSDSETFNVTVPGKLPPVLSPIANRSISHSAPPLTIGLTANDPDGDNQQLQYSVKFAAAVDPLKSKAYALDQQYQLGPEDVSSRNWGGANEKWMLGAGNQWYFITPNGNFYRWTGAAKGANFLSGSTLIDTLSSDFHADPSKLYNAPDPAVGNSGGSITGPGGSAAQIVNKQLVVTPGSGFVGDLKMTVTVTDAQNLTDSEMVTVTLTNALPALSLPDVTIPASQGSATVDLPATDAEGDVLQYQVTVSTSGGAVDPLKERAYAFDQQFGLGPENTSFRNWGGANEKWMQATNTDWYFITPDGKVYRWTGAASGSGFIPGSTLVETLDSTYHANPSLLYNAQPVTTPPSQVTGQIINGNQLVLTVEPNFLGDATVNLDVSDGFGTSSASFTAQVVPFDPSGLTGPVGDLAIDHIPSVAVPAATDFMLDDRANGTGLLTSRTRLAIVPTNAATVGSINELIEALDAQIVGTLASIKTVVISIADIGDLSAIDAALVTLDQSAAIATAAPDVELQALRITRPSNAEDSDVTDHSSDTPIGRDPNPWIWSFPPSEATGSFSVTGLDGNWGLEAVRAPALWNLNEQAEQTQNNVRTAVFDLGFNDQGGTNAHPDGDTPGLQGHIFNTTTGTFELGSHVDAHGQHVAGIVGAAFNNGKGIDGINPFAERHDSADGHFLGVSPRSTSLLVMLDDLANMLSQWPDIKLVNLSLGYGGEKPFMCHPSTLTKVGHVHLGQLFRGIASEHSGTLFVAAAGNESGGSITCDGATEVDASLASPFNWAALSSSPFNASLFPFSVGPLNNIIVVESVDAQVENTVIPAHQWAYAKSDFSNVNGLVSAPGGRILSTVGTNIPEPNDEFHRQKPIDPHPAFYSANYDTFDGTSMAAPHVTGLAGYLLNIDPNLTTGQLAELITSSAHTRQSFLPSGETLPDGVTGPAPMIDAFSAATGIDLLRSNQAIQKSLVDVDNGVDEDLDGNASADRSDLDDDENTTEAFTPIAPPERLGDGTINMKDFRVFRDAYLQVSAKETDPQTGQLYVSPSDVSLDGGDKDLNQDGQVSAGTTNNNADENIYPRFDFNGTGRIDPDGARTSPNSHSLAPFKMDPDSLCTVVEVNSATGAGCVRDIDVLAHPNLWTLDDENVTTSDLLADRDNNGFVDYLRSADFHFHIDPDPESSSSNLLIQVESLKDNPNSAAIWSKTIDLPGPLDTENTTKRIITVPLFGERINNFVKVTVARGNDSAFFTFGAVEYGKDKVIRLKTVTPEITPANANEGTSNSNQLTFDVTLSSEVAESVSFDVSTTDGSAMANADFVPPPANTTVDFAPNQTTPSQIEIDTIPDSLPEARQKTFTVMTSGDIDVIPSTAPNLQDEAVFYVVLPGDPATGTIVDDDELPAGSELWQGDLPGFTVGSAGCFFDNPHFINDASLTLIVPSPGLVTLANDPFSGTTTFSGTFSNMETLVPASNTTGCVRTPVAINTPNTSVDAETGFGSPVIQVSSATQILFHGDYGGIAADAKGFQLQIQSSSANEITGSYQSFDEVNQGISVFGDFTLTKVAGLSAADIPANLEAAILTTDELLPVQEAASLLWSDAGANASRLSSVTVEIVDLPGALIGAAGGDTIFIDQNAAGYGWFVDPTPDQNEEFSRDQSGSLRGSGDAAGRMDLLTVLSHEMGHLLGLDDLDSNDHADDIMADTLDAGVRRLPWASAVDHVFADEY